jgi:dihydroorotate dehydrogenase (fumarate)
MDLSTKYLGLSLKNPVVVASCGLTKTVDQIKKCEEAGAGAVVMKSLFEEQIREMDSGLKASAEMHTEALDYLRAEIEMQFGPRDYLETIQQVKKSVAIPVIASVNCYSAKWWISYAQQIEAAGADALELNIFVFPYHLETSGYNIENAYIEILQAVKQNVNIPIALKLSPYFTALGNLAGKLDKLGADALVLFNRFVQPEVDIAKIQSSFKPSFNDPIGFSNTLRWIALLSGKLKLDLAASGNIRTASDMIKQLLVGATVIQIASILYKDGLGVINQFLTGLTDWMHENNFATIEDFRGRLNQLNNPQSDAYIRAQYLKAISGVE